MINAKYIYKPSPTAKIAHNDPSRFLMIGGGAGGGKSVWLCEEGYQLSAFQPGNRIILMRKVLKHLKETTLVTWKKMISPELATVQEHANRIIVHTAKEPSEILLAGFDTREGISLLSSLEVSAALIDQIEEVGEDEFNMVASRVNGRWKLPNGKRPIERIAGSANPKMCWIKPRFIDNPKPNHKFIQMLAKDNPYLDPDYIPNLIESFKNRPDILKALVYGSWDDFEGFDNVMQMKWVKYMFTNANANDYMDKRVVSCDVARGGDDKNVIYGFHGYKQTHRDIFGGDKRTWETAARCVAMAKLIDAPTIAVNSATIGAGVADEVEKLIKGTNIELLRFVESEASEWPDRYYNCRAEASWELGKLLADQRISAQEDMELADDLVADTWENRTGRIIIQDKKEIKKILGRSPDKGDAFKTGIWAVRKGKQVQEYKDNSSTSKWVNKRKRELAGQVSSYADLEE